jgi:hypothetical protein
VNFNGVLRNFLGKLNLRDFRTHAQDLAAM